MKMLSHMTLAVLLTLGACSHHKKHCCAKKESCSKEKDCKEKCDKKKDCSGDSCSKKEEVKADAAATPVPAPAKELKKAKKK